MATEYYLYQDEESLLWKIESEDGWPGGTLEEATKHAYDLGEAYRKPDKPETFSVIHYDFPVRIKRRAEELGLNLYARHVKDNPHRAANVKQRPHNIALLSPGGGWNDQ